VCGPIQGQLVRVEPQDTQQPGIYELICLVDDDALRSERVESGAADRACGRYPDIRARDKFGLALTDHMPTDPEDGRDTRHVRLTDDANESKSLTLGRRHQEAREMVAGRFKCAAIKTRSPASSAMHIGFPVQGGPG
jgi:hypothetical protein